MCVACVVCVCVCVVRVCAVSRVPSRVEQQGHARHEVQRAPSNLRSSPYLSRFSTINRKLVTNCITTPAQSSHIPVHTISYPSLSYLIFSDLSILSILSI